MKIVTLEHIIKTCLAKTAARWPGELIMYCGACASWDESFTIVNNDLLFWYNIKGGTHAEIFSHQPDAISPPA
jgi:hypothetical protein